MVSHSLINAESGYNNTKEKAFQMIPIFDLTQLSEPAELERLYKALSSIGYFT